MSRDNKEELPTPETATLSESAPTKRMTLSEENITVYASKETVETTVTEATSETQGTVETNETVAEQTKENAALTKKEARKKLIALMLTFFSLQLALFLAALDNTILSTALPKIGSEFNAMQISAWVVNSYVLAFDVFQPLLSKFSDIFGRKLVLMSGMVVFLVGSILCGAAHNIAMLIVGRGIQGTGAAGIFSMVFVIISDIVPLEKRGKYQGIINSVFALSSVFGPLIGGSFTDYVSWRWNFWINLPIGGCGLVILFFFLRIPSPKQNLREKLRRIDYAGNIAVLIAATLFLVALNFGGQMFPWKSAAVIVPLVMSGVFVCVLMFIESKVAKEPLWPPRLFKNRTVVSVLISNVMFGICFFVMVYYLPMYFQIVKGDSAMWSGIRLIPMQMVIAVFSTAAGITISKTGIYRPMLVFGMAFLTLGVGLISLFDLNTQWSKIYGLTVVGACGIGVMFSSTIIAVQAAVETRDIAVVTGLNNFSRVLGGAIGVAIASAVLNTTLGSELREVIPPQYIEIILASPENIRYGHGIPDEYIDIALEAYMKGIQLIWHIFTGFAGVGFLSTFFTKHHTLRRPHGPPPAEKQPGATVDSKEDEKTEVVVNVEKADEAIGSLPKEEPNSKASAH